MLPLKLFRHRKYHHLLGLLLVGALLVSCAAGDGDDDNDGDSNDGGEVSGNAFTLRSETNSDGSAQVEFEVEPESSKFSIVALSEGNNVRMQELSDSAGTDYLAPSGVDLSLAEQFTPELSVANVPSRSIDPRLSSENTFTSRVTVARGNSAVRGTEVTFLINSRVDPDLSSGALTLNLYLVGSNAQSSGARGIILSAVEEMRSIFRTAANIRINLTELAISGPAVLPSPFQGSSFYAAATGTAPSPAVNIFVGTDIDVTGVLGLSSSIPGPAVPTSRSAVVISLLTGAGSDGEFSSEEVRLLGETMAHEGSHLMGLFHPVDVSGTVVVDSDPLSDTEDCNRVSECESTELISNLMYYTPLRGSDGNLIAQNELTAQQRGVLNRYIAVD